MAYSSAIYSSPAATFQASVICTVLAVLVATVGGQNQCQPFSCGHLHNISYPFRRPGDPPGCGFGPYILSCTSGKAILRIKAGTYYVTSINYANSSFWVVNANQVIKQNSCPLPLWDQYTNTDEWVFNPWRMDSDGSVELSMSSSTRFACFVNCSQAIATSKSSKHITCLGSKNSFVYVLFDAYTIRDLGPSCGLLGTAHFDIRNMPNRQLEKVSYQDIVDSIGKGFPVEFYDLQSKSSGPTIITTCLNDSMRYYKEQISGASILNRAHAIFWTEIHFLECVVTDAWTKQLVSVVAIVSAIDIPKFLFGTRDLPVFNQHSYSTVYIYIYGLTHICLWACWEVLCRFVLAPLAVFTFLAQKYWKTKMAIDVVEKFLRMQQMLGPTRYSYTDIVAITGHFRDKLGQGGYGSVYKGVLLPCNVHIAVKMLNANSNCNGEEFINEVSTIGRIHHVNVVRLIGFCPEEMRRALVYEYMPGGSLDKYIFSSDKRFSWDKLNDIALGVARGINYLHQGCEMQILHFDIKPFNILLDSNFVPKVADFGLAKLYPRDNSFVPLSIARGTVGYIAPEMMSRSFGVISSKSDVYSFGMLLLEMAGGRRNADPNAENSSQAYYPSQVYRQLTRRETTDEITDAVDMHELEKKLCIVGLWCIQVKSCDRPTMNKVIEMLEGGIDGLQMPPRSFFCDDEDNPAMDSYHLSFELTAVEEEEDDDDDDCVYPRELN
uniref:Protein kinase domain-containing protein n=1 Tax=Oryza punctata TaxID=4537 RepID=A0A0E0JJM9_ORYPU